MSEKTKKTAITCYPPKKTRQLFKKYCEKKRRSMNKQLLILIEAKLNLRKNPNGNRER